MNEDLKFKVLTAVKMSIVRFQALAGASMKMAAFWVVVPCSLVKFTDVSEVLAASIIRAISLIMEAANTSETSADFCQTTRCNNPEDSHLHVYCSLYCYAIYSRR
jgi:hypothetical protein